MIRLQRRTGLCGLVVYELFFVEGLPTRNVMLGAVIVLCVVIGGSFSQDFGACRRREIDVCNRPEFFIPETKEEMDELCKEWIDSVGCMHKGAEKCWGHIEGDGEVEYLKRISSFLRTDLCSEGSHLYRILSSNLPCLKKTLSEPKECLAGENKKEEKQSLFDMIADSAPEGHGLHLMTMESCVERLFEYACGAAVLERSCGKPVGEAFAAVYVNMDSVIDDCPQEVVEQRPYVTRALLIATENEEEAVDAIGRRKK